MGPPPESARSWAAIRTPLRRPSSKKRALVTGGAGCLGSHPCDRVLAGGYSVVEGSVDAVLHFANPASPRDNHALDGTIGTLARFTALSEQAVCQLPALAGFRAETMALLGLNSDVARNGYKNGVRR